MALIVISDPVCFKGESNLINQLFEAGLSVLHLRKPGVNKLSYEKLIAEIDIAYHSRIALHQFHELSKDFPSIKRLHYPEQLRLANFECDLKQIHGYTFSTSIHHLNDFNELKGFDYTFYGPVFNSISKLGYTGLSKEKLKLPHPQRKVKIIGLGGISYENIGEVKQMGFDGVAVLGSIWNNKESAVMNLKSLLIQDTPQVIQQ